jgi:PAS domain S-box-containing protein
MTADEPFLTRLSDIMVVDDSIESLRTLTDILTQAGYKVRPVEKQHLALEAARIKPLSLFLLDVKMPEMSGFEVCRHLKDDKRTCDVPVIFVIGLEDVQERLQGFEVGGVDFITTPIQEAEVLARVETHLQLRFAQLQMENLVAEKTAEIVDSEARFRATFEQAAVGIAHVAPDGTFLRLNQKFCDIVGYAHAEMLTRTFQDMTHPDDLDTDIEHLRRLLSGEADTYSMEKRYIRKDGEIVWVNLTVSQVGLEKGKLDYFVSVVEDISARKHAEEELSLYRENLESLLEERSAALNTAVEQISTLFEFSPLGVALTNYDGQFLAVNQSLLDMLCTTREKLLQGKVADVYVDPRQREALLAELREDGTLQDTTLHLQRDDGSSFFARLNSSQIVMDGNVCLLAMVDDVTEQIAAEQRTAVLEERERLARELHDAVTQTLFSASLLADTAPRLWEKDQALAVQNLHQVGRLMRGALAEMRTLLFELRPAAMEGQSLGKLLDLLADIAHARTRATVKLSVTDDRYLPQDINTALFRIAQEALNNMAKHAEATQVRIDLISTTNNGLKLCIQDNGRGFDPATIPSGHLGIGIMTERAATIGAEFRVESRLGEGTKITVVWTDPIEGEWK